MVRKGDKPYESEIFKLGRGKFGRLLFLFYGYPWIILFALLTGVGVLLGFLVSPICFILSLLIVFIIVPMALAFLYFYYGLRRGCYLNTVMHSIKPTETGLDIKLIFRGIKDVEEKTDQEKEKDIEEKTIEFSIPFERIKSLKVDVDGVYFITGGTDQGFVWLPENAYGSKDEFVSAVRFISDRI